VKARKGRKRRERMGGTGKEGRSWPRTTKGDFRSLSLIPGEAAGPRPLKERDGADKGGGRLSPPSAREEKKRKKGWTYQRGGRGGRSLL